MSVPETSSCPWPALRVVVAGGGTGGHLFPGIAVAGAFMARNPDTRVLFVGSGRPFEKEALARAGFSRKTIAVEGIKGRRVWDKIRAGLKIPVALWQSMKILGAEKADLVVAMGGYAAGPVGLAAWLRGICLVVCEQNTIPGITQRMLFPFASRIFVSFEKTRGAIDPSRKRVVGNPVRGNILAVSGRPDEKQAEKTEKKDRLTILVLGGSQGAHALNQAMTNALCHLEPLSRLRVVHQTGEKDQDAVAAAYARHGVEAEVEVFFHDMAACYQQTDLVICRAGATTIAELAALGKPAIFVPYPFAADNHQEHNARFLVDQGAGRMILEKDLTGPALAGEINEMAASPDLLARMADGIRRLGRPDAAEKIVEDCCQLLKAGACT